MLFRSFLTYGDMSVREIEAMAVGLEETMDFDMIRHGPEFIAFMADELDARGVPVVKPAGGLGCHLNARAFLPHVPQNRYTAGALAAAVFIAGGVRGMERGDAVYGRLFCQAVSGGIFFIRQLLLNAEAERFQRPRKSIEWQ